MQLNTKLRPKPNERKLTNSDKQEICRLLVSGYNIHQIASELGHSGHIIERMLYRSYGTARPDTLRSMLFNTEQKISG